MKLKKQHILIVALAALVAAPALAAGIPQIEQKETYPGQLAWLAISFVLLYFMVSTYIAPRISGVLTERERAISDAIATAEQLKEAASNTRGNFEAAGTEARANAAALVAKAVADAAKEAAEAQAKLHAELETKEQASRERISKAVAKASREVDDAAQSLADAMSAKLLAAEPAVAKKKAS